MSQIRSNPPLALTKRTQYFSSLNVFLDWFFKQRKINSQSGTTRARLKTETIKNIKLLTISLDAVVSAEQVKLDIILSSTNLIVDNFSPTLRKRCYVNYIALKHG